MKSLEWAPLSRPKLFAPASITTRSGAGRLTTVAPIVSAVESIPVVPSATCIAS